MMSSTAKLTLTFLTMAALGATAFACTTTSSISNDTDGGVVDNGDSETDAGVDSGPKAFVLNSVCQTKLQKTELVNDDCQKCVETSCCTKLQGCYDIVPADKNANTDCEEYSHCTAECQSSNDDGGAACQQACDLVAENGIVQAYDDLSACVDTSCKTECNVP